MPCTQAAAKRGDNTLTVDTSQLFKVGEWVVLTMAANVTSDGFLQVSNCLPTSWAPQQASFLLSARVDCCLPAVGTCR